MKNYRSDFTEIKVTAPEGGLTSGVPAIVNGLFCVPQTSGAEGDLVGVLTAGKVAMTKASGTVFTPSAAVAYYNATTGLITATTTDRRVGIAMPAASGTTEVEVIFWPGADAVGGSSAAITAADVSLSTAIYPFTGSVQDAMDICFSKLFVHFTDRFNGVLVQGAATAGTLTGSLMKSPENGTSALTCVLPIAIKADGTFDMSAVAAISTTIPVTKSGETWSAAVTQSGSTDLSGVTFLLFSVAAPT